MSAIGNGPGPLFNGSARAVALTAELTANPVRFAELYGCHSDDARDPLALLCAIVLRSGDAQRESFLEARALVGRIIRAECEFRPLAEKL